MSKRKSVRELALKVLYQIEVGKLPPEEALEATFESVRTSGEETRAVTALVEGVLGELDQLDALIGDYAEGWTLERLAKVDKNVLRVALYELRNDPGAPVSAVINDAVDLAKKFSMMEDSGRFVNGILGSYVRRRQQEPGGTGDTGER